MISNSDNWRGASAIGANAQVMRKRFMVSLTALVSRGGIPFATAHVLIESCALPRTMHARSSIAWNQSSKFSLVDLPPAFGVLRVYLQWDAQPACSPIASPSNGFPIRCTCLPRRVIDSGRAPGCSATGRPDAASRDATTSGLGQSRRVGRLPVASGLPRTSDKIRSLRHLSYVPQAATRTLSCLFSSASPWAR